MAERSYNMGEAGGSIPAPAYQSTPGSYGDAGLPAARLRPLERRFFSIDWPCPGEFCRWLGNA